MTRSVQIAIVALAVLLTGGCQRDSFDWDAPENVKLEQEAEEQDDGSVEMRFVSLVNAPADDLFRALADVGNHDEFIEGVTESTLVSSKGNVKVVEITNQVFGRPNTATIEWTIDEPNRTISFKTLKAPFTDNSAEYRVEPSPDGKRAKVVTVYHLRDKGAPFPIHALKTALIDGYVAAVRGVKRRALGPQAVVGP